MPLDPDVYFSDHARARLHTKYSKMCAHARTRENRTDRYDYDLAERLAISCTLTVSASS